MKLQHNKLKVVFVLFTIIIMAFAFTGSAETTNMPENLSIDEDQWESWTVSGKCKLFPFMSAGNEVGFSFEPKAGQADSLHKECKFTLKNGEKKLVLKEIDMYYCVEKQSIIYAGLSTHSKESFETSEFKEACIRLMQGYNIGFDSQSGKAVLNLSRERAEEVVNYCLENVERCLVDNMRIRVIRNEDDNYYSFHMEY